LIVSLSTQIPAGAPLALGPPRAFVSGEVEEHRVRPPPAESRWLRARYRASALTGGEDRRFVLDVHYDGAIVRIVEGGIAPNGLPGAEAHAGRRGLARFLETLEAAHPGVPVEPRRTCGASAGDGRADGWDVWEEHSRLCRRVRVG